MIKRLHNLLAICLLSMSLPALAANTPQDTFFQNLKTLCGKAFAGKIVVDNAPSDAFSNKPLVMHVRQCSDDQILIPFHVGGDASRTWVLTRTANSLQLKHDHRHKDGSEDTLTQYGGHTLEAGWPQVQSFPADDFTKALFVREAIPQSMGNTWQFYLYPTTFTYRMVREAREFRVDFDLTQPVRAPAAPWGWQ
ncbi:hypothetical protein [Simiduia agarivorans]|uniref:Secreted protein n=1 Tax=Simiduia agarivorans (strain DSM 21679 / JCM 13881 / BCRC 17597 / SA1) TaxID=1117647 RepID=K4KLR7_SIMAS|nr:hypothetical protein [Simiduia agarivorans]AFU99981.1 hypothetical protein M5M_14225 [Simiduia agarivorans SA1 = DSM 21679]